MCVCFPTKINLFVISNGCSCVQVLLNNYVNKKIIAHFIESVNKVKSPLNMQTENCFYTLYHTVLSDKYEVNRKIMHNNVLEKFHWDIQNMALLTGIQHIYIYRVIYILGTATDGCRSRSLLACPPLHGASNCRCSQTLALFFSNFR